MAFLRKNSIHSGTNLNNTNGISTFRPSPASTAPTPSLNNDEYIDNRGVHPHSRGPLDDPIYAHHARHSAKNTVVLEDTVLLNNGHSGHNNGDVRLNNMYEMSTHRPPPPMYRRVPPPAHMMTLDRRVPGTGNHLQHQLLPNGCDVTLNRRHYNGASTGPRGGQNDPRGSQNGHRSLQRRRHPEDLWLV